MCVLDNPKLVSSVPVTVQVLDVNDNAPHIQIDSDIIVCDSTKAGQVGLSLRNLFIPFLSLYFSLSRFHLWSILGPAGKPLSLFSPLSASFYLFPSSILFPSARFSRSKPFTSPQTLYPLSVFNSCCLINTFTHLYTHIHILTPSGWDLSVALQTSEAYGNRK